MPNQNRLPDEAWVVRCGVPPFEHPTNLPKRSDYHRDEPKVYGFSVQSDSGVAWERLASWCRNRRVGLLTVAVIRDLGYDVIITPGIGYHATVIVPPDWSQDAAEILAASFQSVENPAPDTKQ